MISERKLVSSHSSFWRHLMPMGDSFVRLINSSRERYSPPIVSRSKPDRNALISELSFRLFEYSVKSGKNIYEVDIKESFVSELAHDVVNYVSRLDKNIATGGMVVAEIIEAKSWAESLHLFTLRACPSQKIVTRPRFQGCGIVDICEGDLLVGTTLWELKNVERDFRLADIKQLLTYCALNYASQQYPIESIGLVNARQGVWFRTGIESLAVMASAMSESELLGEVVRYITVDGPSR